MSACACSKPTDAPNGILKGILSGTALRSGGAAGAGAACCWANAWPLANKPLARMTACKIRDVIRFPPVSCGIFLAAPAIIEEKERCEPAPNSNKSSTMPLKKRRQCAWRAHADDKSHLKMNGPDPEGVGS